jgi:hypothetical protein
MTGLVARAGRILPLLLGLAVGGCVIAGDRFEVVEPVDPAQPAPGAVGPAIVIDVTNASEVERTVDYQFADEVSSGNGGGLIGPCERSVTPYGPVAGTYEIRVDGEPIHEGRVPEGQAVSLIVTITIRPTGEAVVTGTRFSDTSPPLGARRVPCS